VDLSVHVTWHSLVLCAGGRVRRDCLSKSEPPQRRRGDLQHSKQQPPRSAMAAPGPPARRGIRRVYLSLHLLQPSARSHTPGSTPLRFGVEEALKLLRESYIAPLVKRLTALGKRRLLRL
jgi:hypothetical protein